MKLLIKKYRMFKLIMRLKQDKTKYFDFYQESIFKKIFAVRKVFESENLPMLPEILLKFVSVKIVVSIIISKSML